MGNSKVAKKGSLYDKADKKLRKWAGTIGAIIALIGAATGICTWVSSQFQNVVSTQIEALRNERRESDKKREQQITRLELANLIHNQPNNKAEIEKVAKYYFITLDGDWYMTGLYSSWATEYGGDVTIIIGKE